MGRLYLFPFSFIGRLPFLIFLSFVTFSVTKKLPNVYKSCPKMISIEKLKIFTPLQKLPMSVGDFGKLIVAKGFEKLPKVHQIAQSGHTGYLQRGWHLLPPSFSLLLLLSSFVSLIFKSSKHLTSHSITKNILRYSTFYPFQEKNGNVFKQHSQALFGFDRKASFDF